MTNTTKQPQAGEWWQYNGVRIRVVGTMLNGWLVCEYRDGKTASLTCGEWWTHLPSCTGFDWHEPPAEQPKAEQSADAAAIKALEGLLSQWRFTDSARHKIKAVIAIAKRAIEQQSPELCQMCNGPAIPGTGGCRDCTEYTIAATGCLVESPEDWVTQDREPDRDYLDEWRWVYPDGATAWFKSHGSPHRRHGEIDGTAKFEVRCRRKDLPRPELKPVESPDDWVEIDKTTHADHMPRAGVDVLLGSDENPSVAQKRQTCGYGCRRVGHKTWEDYKWVCRRKDLPQSKG